MRIAIIGLGFVGDAMIHSFIKRKVNVYGYDKYKDGGIGTYEKTLDSDILFLALPTCYSYQDKSYDKTAIEEVLNNLNRDNYDGIIALKSTVEPGTTELLSKKYDKLNLVHNGEFLTARTRYKDFDNQGHIVLGKAESCDQTKFQLLYDFYHKFYPVAEISVCKSGEAESMKIYCNNYYAVKVQFFNELYLLCQKDNINFDRVRDLMIKNKFINIDHTSVPGPDGQLSYGGLCFPKDTNALLEVMKRKDVPHSVLEATINERNKMRTDNDNIH